MADYEVPRILTGITGIDDMLGGGIPEKGILLLCGGPGVGKTIFTLQYMMAAVERGEPCVYITLEEPMEKKTLNARAFGWDIKKAEEDDMIATLDIYMVPHSQGVVEQIDRKRGKIQFSIAHEIEAAVKRIGAKHIIIDPLTSILVHESRSGKKRHLIGQLFDSIRRMNCTAIVTSEGLPKVNEFYMERARVNLYVYRGHQFQWCGNIS